MITLLTYIDLNLDSNLDLYHNHNHYLNHTHTNTEIDKTQPRQGLLKIACQENLSGFTQFWGYPSG